MLTKTEIENMPASDKLELAWMLWDSAFEEENKMPLPEWQKKILDERLSYSLAHPDSTRPWQEAMARIEARLKNVRSAH